MTLASVSRLILAGVSAAASFIDGSENDVGRSVASTLGQRRAR